MDDGARRSGDSQHQRHHSPTVTMKYPFLRLIPLVLLVSLSWAFSPAFVAQKSQNVAFSRASNQHQPSQSTRLYMSDRERTRSTKKGVQTIIKDRTETKAEEQKKKEEMWRVV